MKLNQLGRTRNHSLKNRSKWGGLYSINELAPSSGGISITFYHSGNSYLYYEFLEELYLKINYLQEFFFGYFYVIDETGNVSLHQAKKHL